MLAATMIAMETSASHQQVEALETAEGARFSPMRMMMGQKAHHPMDSHHLDHQGQDHIEQPRHHNAAAGVLELLAGGHGSVLAGV